MSRSSEEPAADEESLFPRGAVDWRAPPPDPPAAKPLAEKPLAEKPPAEKPPPPRPIGTVPELPPARPLPRPIVSRRAKAAAAWLVFGGALAFALYPLLRPREAAPLVPAAAPAAAPTTRAPARLTPPSIVAEPARPTAEAAIATAVVPATPLASSSSFQAAIARAIASLEAARRTFPPDSIEASRAASDFVDEIRALGSAGAPAMKDAILARGDDDVRLLLAQALGGLDAAVAVPALAELIRTAHETKLRAALLRDLPAGPEAAGLVAETFEGEVDPRVRRTLLLEYSRRLFGEAGGADASAALGPTAPDPSVDQALLRSAAIREPDPAVRGAAFAIVARRGDPRDSDLVREALEHETDPGVRRAAMNALARTTRARPDR